MFIVHHKIMQGNFGHLLAAPFPFETPQQLAANLPQNLPAGTIRNGRFGQDVNSFEISPRYAISGLI
jgi:hypothetical protein